MKKTASLIMALVLCATLAIGVSANETLITYTHEEINDPTYTITIPSEIELSQRGTAASIVASDVENLVDQAISVTVEGTDAYRNQFLVSRVSDRVDPTEAGSIRYSITLSDDTVLATTGGKDQYVGAEIASFTGNGAETLVFTALTEGVKLYEGAEYAGSITYGIELIDA